MATHAAAQAELCRLRRDIARIEGRLAEADRLVLDPAPRGAAVAAADIRSNGGQEASPGLPGKGLKLWALKPRERRGRLRLGIAAFDRIVGGGLPLASFHEIRASESRDGGAAAGFVLALLARLGEAGGAGSAVWISEAGSRREAGILYAPGLAALGLDPAGVIEVAARTDAEALWAFEAALSCRGVGVAVCEMRQVSLDLTATRRCALRAREAGVTGFLLRHSGKAEPTAAELRFRVGPAPAGAIGSFGAGVGRMAWRLALEKNRGGRTGTFTVEWNAYERCFAERKPREKHADSQPVAAAAANRPPPAGEKGRGDIRPFQAPGFKRAS